MKVARMAWAILLVSWGALALAHARLLKADPADGSTLKVAPAKFVLTFGEPVRLTMLTLRKDAEPAKKLGPLPTDAAAEISIPAPKLASGKYILSWRVVGSDGHVLPEELSFTVGPSAATSAPGSTG
jgi:copper transport protein